ncbi:GFA family protein [Pyruvatibacter sp. HU-CL02332]|uniref:GFA family protein n=1 Tax=Pyruvatibacter sp. HU-CL02332 TaxID=3127650 RepID=UPI0029690D7A|nr:GFA family protein [Alphaproteobacteria bacterium]
MSDIKLEGGCQCGAVRYVLTTPPIMAYACHCTECQRIAGSSFAIACAILQDSMEITQGDLARVDWTVESGAHRYGEFCKACGTRIRHGSVPEQGIYSLRGGTLDDKDWAYPVAHIWQSSKIDWITPPKDALTYDGQPADYTPIIEAYRSRMGLA